MSELFTEMESPVVRRVRSAKWLVWVVGGLPVVAFFVFFWFQAVNVPYQDDFDGLLEPAITFSKPDLTIDDIWTAYATQDDERRIITNRMAVHAQYLLTGEFNFRTHILAGSLVLLLALGVFWVWFRRNRWSPWLFVPVPFMLFHPQYFDAILWSIIPFQHVAVYIWALLAIWLISRDTRQTFGWAIMAAVIALLSDVTGLLPFIVGGVLLVIQQRWRQLAVWVAVTALALGTYFHHFEVPGYRPSFSDNIKLPGTMLQLWLSMQGLWADAVPRLPFAVRLGLTILVGLAGVGLWVSSFWQSAALYLKKRQVPNRQVLFLYGGVLLFLGVFTLFATGRTVEGVQAAFITRYRFMHMAWLVLLYLLLLYRLPARLRQQTWLVAVAVGGSVLYSLTLWFQYASEAKHFRQALLADLHSWQHHRIIPSTPIYFLHKEVVDNWMEQAEAKGIFRYDNPQLEALAQAPIAGKAEVQFDENKERLGVNLLSMPQPAFSSSAEVYVLIREKNAAYDGSRAPLIFPTVSTRSSVLGWLRSGRLLNTPYAAQTILKQYLTDPTPTIEIGVIDGERVVRYEAGQNPTLSLPLPKN
ncbi:hypothetical protein ACAW74_08415 [Fibrella sp. WM1]|uniref:hypothetical protein n=1 Tax=Fibrella musci TaxID=3242485 RepID=UPI00352188CB